MAETTPPGNTPKITVETPIPFPTDSNIVKSPTQPGAETYSPPLKLLWDTPDVRGKYSIPKEVMDQYHGSLPSEPDWNSLDYTRANDQGVLEVAANGIHNAFTNFFSGVGESVGYTLNLKAQWDAIRGVESDYSSAFTDWVQKSREESLEAHPVYEADPQSINPFSEAFWANELSNQAYSAGMMVPDMLATILIGKAGIGLPKGMNPSLKFFIGSSAGAITGSMGESLMEAHEGSERVYKDALALGYNEKQASELRGKAGSNIYNHNIIALTLSNLSQSYLAFGPEENLAALRGNGYSRFLKSKPFEWSMAAVSQAGEEIYQNSVSNAAYDDVLRGTYMPDKSLLGRSLEAIADDPNTQRAAFSGALGGVMFNAIGSYTPKLIESFKESAEYKESKRKGKAELKKDYTPEAINKVRDDIFLDMVTRNATYGKLGNLQKSIAALQSQKDEDIVAMGRDPKEFKDELATRQEQIKHIGKMYNSIYTSNIHPEIKSRLFKSYSAKYLNEAAHKKINDHLDILIDDEIEKGTIKVTDREAYINSLISEELDRYQPSDVFEAKTLYETRKEYAKKKLPFTAKPTINDHEIRNDITALTALSFENDNLDRAIMELNRPSFQKELLSNIEKGKQEALDLKEKDKEEKKDKETKINSVEEQIKNRQDTKEAPKPEKVSTQPEPDPVADPEKELPDASKDILATSLASALIDVDGDLGALDPGEVQRYYKNKDLVDKKMEELRNPAKATITPKPVEEVPVVETPVPKPEKEVKFRKTPEVKQQLKGLGYTDTDIIKMRNNQAQEVLAQGIVNPKAAKTQTTEAPQAPIIPTIEDEVPVEPIVTDTDIKGIKAEKEARDDKYETLFQYNRVRSVLNKLAIFSRAFVDVFKFNQADQSVERFRVSTQDKLWEGMSEPKILSDKHYPVGTSIKIVIFDHDDQPMYAGKDNRKETTWGDFKRENVIEKDQEHLYVPMQVQNESGKVIAYIHNINWVHANNVEEAVLEDAYDDLANQRKFFAANKVTKAKISERGPGILGRAMGDQQVPVNIGMPDSKIVVVGRLGNTGNLEMDATIRNWSAQTGISVYEGDVLAVVPGTKPVVAITKSRKLSTVEISSVSKAVENFIMGKGDFADKIEQDMGIDITSSDGLREYLKRFIYLTDVPRDYDEYGKANSPLHAYTVATGAETEDYFIALKGNSISWVEGGGVYAENVSQNTKSLNAVKVQLAKFTKHLAKTYLTVDKNLIDKTEPITLFDESPVTTRMNYSERFKESQTSRVLGFNIGSKEEPEYIYRLNPVINFEIEGNKVSTPEITFTDPVTAEKPSKKKTPLTKKINYSALDKMFLAEEILNTDFDADKLDRIINPDGSVSAAGLQRVYKISFNRASRLKENIETLLEGKSKKEKPSPKPKISLDLQEKMKRMSEEFGDEDARPVKSDNSEDARPLTKDQLAEVNKMAKDNVLIEGIDALDVERVTRGISSILIKNLTDFTKSTMNTKAMVGEFEKIRSLLKDKRREYEIELEAYNEDKDYYEANKVENKAIIQYHVRVSERVGNINTLLNDFEKLKDLVYLDLSSVSGIEVTSFKVPTDELHLDVKKMIDEGQGAEEDQTDRGTGEDNGEQRDQDEEGIEDVTAEDWTLLGKLKKSIKQSATPGLKLFLRGLDKVEVTEIQDGDQKGISQVKPITNTFGLPETLNPDQVIEYLIPLLTNKFMSFDAMVHTMDVESGENGWLHEVVRSLKASSTDIKKDFHKVFNKVECPMTYVFSAYNRRQIENSEDFTESHTIMALKDNISESNKIIRRTWASDMTNSPLIYSVEGDLFVNKEVKAKYLDLFKNQWTKGKLPTKEVFNDFLNSFGIKLNAAVLDKLTGKKGIIYRGNRILYKDQFTSKEGIVRNLIEKLIALNDPETGRVRLKLEQVFDSGIISELARQEAKNSPHLRSTSYMSGGKSVAAHIDPTFVAKRTFDLQNGELDNLRQKAFNGTNLWMDRFTQFKPLLDKLSWTYLSLSPYREANTINYNREYHKHDELNKEIVKLGLFTSMFSDPVYSDSGVNHRMAGYFYPTPGDSSQNVVISGPKEQFIIKPSGVTTDDKDLSKGLVTKKMVDYIYNYVFLSEARRIALSQTNPTRNFVNGKDLFYFIPSLNKLSELWDSDHKFLYDGDKGDIIKGKKVDLVRAEIKEFIEKEIKNKLDKWTKLGIGSSSYAHIDNKYLDTIRNQIKNSEKGAIATKGLILKNIVADYVVNNMLALHSMHGLYITDPALEYKQSKDNAGLKRKSPAYDFNKDIRTTLQTIGKRLKTDVGPASQEFTETIPLKEQNFSVLMVQDITNSLEAELEEFYKKIGLSEQDIDLYRKTVQTDGVIFNHPLEHLESSYKFSKITEFQRDLGLDYYKKYGTLSPNIPITTLKTRYEDIINTAEAAPRIHLKSAEFYLSPELVDGSPILSRIYDLMQGGKVAKVAFESTLKTGKVEELYSLFNDKGGINNKPPQDGNYLTLNRSGYQLQTNTPNRENDAYIRFSTQFMKQLFIDIGHLFKDEIKEFNGAIGDIVKEQVDRLFDEIGYDAENNDFDISKFSERLIEHLKKHTTDLNVFSSLSIVEDELRKKLDFDPNDSKEVAAQKKKNREQMKSPLFAAGHTGMIQPYVMSLMSDVVSRIHIPGSTYTLAPETYIGGSSKGITYVEGYNPEVIDAAGNVSKVGLKHFREENGEIKRSQVLISWPFPNLSIDDYKNKEGKIDLSLFPPDLLNLIATRIPVSKQASMQALEVVGFLPRNYKGVIITSGQFLAKTGEDYDDDKIYFYYKPYQKVKDSTDIIVDSESPRGKIVDIAGKVLLDPRKEVQKQVHQPVTTHLLDNTFNALYKKFADTVTISPMSEEYFSRTYANESTVADMISISANAMNMHSMLQQAALEGKQLQMNFGPKQITIAGETSDRTLGNRYAQDGNQISDIISTDLQAAVDNTNIQYLSVMNLGNDTYSAANQATLEGFSEEVSKGLINQDIIKDFIEVSKDIKRNPVKGIAKLNIIRKLALKYNNPMVIDILAAKEDDVTKLKKFNEYFEYLGTSKFSAIAKVPKEIYLGGKLSYDNIIHWESFVYFQALGAAGTELTSYQSLLNIDSKGLGTKINQADEKIEFPLNIAFKNKIKNATALLGDYIIKDSSKPIDGYIYLGFKNIGLLQDESKHVFVKPTTVFGITSVYARQIMTKTILNTSTKHLLYPFGTNSFRTLLDRVYRTTKSNSKAAFVKNKTKDIVYNAALSYLYSAYSSNLFNVSDADVGENRGVTARRQELSMNTKDRKSTAFNLRKAQLDPYFSNNTLFRRLTVNLNSEVHTVEYEGTQRDEISRNDATSGFYSALNSDKVIKGTTVTGNELVEELVELAFLNGGLQNSRNYIKIIPSDYLHIKGFYQYLYNVDFSDPEIFGIKNFGNFWDLSSFERQLYRHYPELISFEDKNAKGKDITLVKEIPAEYKENPPAILKYGTSSGKTYLYYYNGENYDIQESLASYPNVQFDANVDENRPIQASKRIPRAKRKSTSSYKVASPRLVDFEALHNLYTAKRSVPEILDNLIQNSQSQHVKDNAVFIKDAFAKGITKIEFSIDLSLKGRDGRGVRGLTDNYKPGKARVRVNPSEAIDASDYEETIVHEMNHPIIKELFTNYTRIPNIKNKAIANNLKTAKTIFDLFKSKLQQEHDVLDKSHLEDSGVHDSIINATKNFDEFLTEALYSKVLRNYLNQGIWEGSTTLWDKLLKVFANILRASGISRGDRLADRIDLLFKDQMVAVTSDRIAEYQRMKKDIEANGAIQNFTEDDIPKAETLRDKYNELYGSGVATLAAQSTVVSIDFSKILDNMVNLLPEAFIKGEYTDAIETLQNIMSPDSKMFTDVSQVKDEHIEEKVYEPDYIKKITKQANALSRFGDDRVVDVSDSEFYILKPGFAFSSIDERPKGSGSSVSSMGNTFSFLEEQAALNKAKNLTSIYGSERVSEVTNENGNYVVELYSDEDARDAPTEKKPKTKDDIIKNQINEKMKELAIIARDLELDYKDEIVKDKGKLSKVNELNNQINELKQNLKEFAKPRKIEAIQKYLNGRLTVLRSIIDDPTLTKDEMANAYKEVDWLKYIGTVEPGRNHLILGDYAKSSGIVDSFTDIGKEASNLKVTLVAKVIDYMGQEANRLRANSGDEITPKMMSQNFIDAGELTANTDTILGLSNHPVVVTLARGMNSSNIERDTESKEEFDRTDDAIRKYLATSQSKNFDRFFQKNSKGEVIPYLIHPFSSKHFKDLGDIWAKSRAEPGGIAKHYIPWANKNINFIDARMLYPTIEGEFYHYEDKTFDDRERAEYVAKLKDEYGDYIFNKIKKDVLDKINRFKSEYELLHDKYESNENISADFKVKQLKKFELEHSPYAIAEKIKDGSFIKGIKPDYKYTTQPPKRFVTGTKTLTGLVNEDFYEISNNKDYLDLYEIANDLLTSINTLDPDAYKGVLQSQAIPYLDQTFAEAWLSSNSKVTDLTHRMYDNYIKSIQGLDDPSVNFTKLRPNGTPIYEAHKNFGNEAKHINEIRKRLKLDLLVDLSKVETTDELKKVLNKWEIETKNILPAFANKKVSINSLSDFDQSFVKFPEVNQRLRTMASDQYYSKGSKDLGTILKYYTVMLNTYKSRHKTEALMNLGMALIDNLDVVKVNSNGDLIERPDGELETTSAEKSKLAEVMKLQLKVFFGGSSKKKGKKLKNKVYTTEEAKLKKKYEEQLKNDNLSPDLKAMVQDQINIIGKPAYVNNLIDGLLGYVSVLGLAYKVTVANSNLLQSLFTNTVEAASGRFITDASSKQAKKMLFWSVLKNLSFNKFEHPTAKKIRGIMDYYNLLQDQTSEYYKSSNLSFGNRLRFLSPRQITSRTEYIAQGEVMIVAFLDHKVSELIPDWKGEETIWDAHGPDGKWDSDKFGPRPGQSLDNFILKITRIKDLIYGPYSNDWTLKGKQTLGGRALFVYHTWVPNFIRIRFGKEHVDPYLGVTLRGRYRTIGNLVGIGDKLNDESIWSNIKFVLSNYLKQSAYNEKYTAHDAANLKSFLREVSVYISLTLMNLVLKAAGNLGDDDKENDTDNFLIYYAINSSARLQQDIAMIYRFATKDDAQRNIVPLFGLAKSLEKFRATTFQVMRGEEDGMSNLTKATTSFIPGITDIDRTTQFLTTDKSKQDESELEKFLLGN